MARIGIYGGTFDPVHVGHIAVARQALDEFRLAQMLLIPAKDPWLKKRREDITISSSLQNAGNCDPRAKWICGISDRGIARGPYLYD